MPRLKPSRPDFSGFKPDPEVSVRQEVARFMWYARKVAPGVFVSYPEIAQRVYGRSKPFRIDSHEVKTIRSTLSYVRNQLMTEHGCGLTTDPIAGMRATANDGDLLREQVVKTATRLRSAANMHARTSDLVDIQNVPNTPEFAALKSWHKTANMPVVKAIMSTDFATKLLPPKRDGEEKK